MKKGFYAILAVLTVFAMTMVSCGGGDTDPTYYTVTFDLNGGSGSAPADASVVEEGSVTLPALGDVGPKDKPFFIGWSTTADGTAIKGSSYGPITDDITLFAVWSPPVTEKVSLSNATQVVYRFVLPAGKKWSDYQNVRADYMIATGPEFEVENSGRAIRLYGPYNLDYFQFNETVAGNKYAYASIANPNNGPYILATVKSDHNTDLTNDAGGWRTLSAALIRYFGECPNAGDWFTIEYLTDASTKNSAYNMDFLPKDDATGPFIFGLGLPGQGDANTFSIKNVTLKGKTEGTADLLASPLFINKDGYDYPAFAAYGTPDGNGVDDLKREAIEGTYPQAVPAVDPPTYTITFNLGSGGGTFVAAEGLTISGSTATMTAVEYWGLDFHPKASRIGEKVKGWALVANGTVDDIISVEKVFTEDTELFAVWVPGLPDATEDLVITPKVSSFGGLGSQNDNAGNGPFDYNAAAQYACAIWFGLTNAVETAEYRAVTIEFTVGNKTDGDAKLAFHAGRAANQWGGGNTTYNDYETDGAKTKTIALSDDLIDKGLIIQQNGGASFRLTINKITLLKP